MQLVAGLHPWLCADSLARLRDFHVEQLPQLLARDPEELASILGIAYSQAVALLEDLTREHGVFAVSGLHLYQRKLKQEATLPSGNQHLDKLLRGGFHAGKVYEVYGLAGSGKSQLCMQLAIVAARHFAESAAISPAKIAANNSFVQSAGNASLLDGDKTAPCKAPVAYTEPSVLYIDTKGDVCPRRVLEVLQNCSGSGAGPCDLTLLSRIHVTRAFSQEELLSAVSNAVSLITSRKSLKTNITTSNNSINNTSNIAPESPATPSPSRTSPPAPSSTGEVRLVIVDNIATPLLPTIGTEEFSETLGVASQIIQQLQRICDEGVCVVCTNNARLTGGELRPALGTVWTNLADVRLKLEPADTDKVEEGNSPEGEPQTPANRYSLLSRRRLSVLEGIAPANSCTVTVSRSGIL